MRQFLIALVIVAALIGGYFYYSANNQPFDPDQVSAEIVNTVGASHLTNTLLAGAVCSVMGDQVCLGHNKSAKEARDIINRIVAKTDAKAASDWSASTGGYSRVYSYGQYGTFSVLVTNELLNIRWRTL